MKTSSKVTFITILFFSLFANFKSYAMEGGQRRLEPEEIFARWRAQLFSEPRETQHEPDYQAAEQIFEEAQQLFREEQRWYNNPTFRQTIGLIFIHLLISRIIIPLLRTRSNTISLPYSEDDIFLRVCNYITSDLDEIMMRGLDLLIMFRLRNQIIQYILPYIQHFITNHNHQQIRRLADNPTLLSIFLTMIISRFLF